MIASQYIFGVIFYNLISYFIIYNSILLSVIIFLIGIISLYIGNIQQEILSRPRYLIEDKIKYHTNNNIYVNGGICEMTFCYLLNELKIIDVENLLENKVINNKKIVFMNNINNGEGPDSKEQYELINNIIKIQKSSNGEDNYLYDKINKQFLVLMNIHFQGGAKSLMNENLKKFLNY